MIAPKVAVALASQAVAPNGYGSENHATVALHALDALNAELEVLYYAMGATPTPRRRAR